MDPRQLAILEPIPLQQLQLLLLAKQHMFRHQLVHGDVDQQITFLEQLENLGCYCARNLVA